MASQYNHSAIEKKWRENWEKNPINVNDGKKEKYYCLDMFPYPSGNGLHVGHWRGYVISDVWSRYQLLKGKYVIHPMGWDAFGLPAENYAIKMGVHPAKSTAANIANIKRQIKQIAAIYDWDMEVNTTDPEFYKWTQWIFVQMFKKGLAYEKEFPINWCPSCKTGLANEEVVNGCCERCGTPVTKKNLRQWMLKITAYAERLLNDLDKLDWPEKVKKMQTDWIGKSYGAEVEFPIEGRDEKITVYTTRPDTLYGATFMVLAPEHKLAKSLATDETREEVEKYIFDSSMRSNVDRMQAKEKTGVFTGSYAINPLNGAKVPIWLSDYVLADYADTTQKRLYLLDSGSWYVEYLGDAKTLEKGYFVTAVHPFQIQKMAGDLDGDFQLTSADVELLMQNRVADPPAADANFDGTVDSADAVYLAHVVQYTHDFQIQCAMQTNVPVATAAREPATKQPVSSQWNGQIFQKQLMP